MPESQKNVLDILEGKQTHLGYGSYQNPSEILPSGFTRAEYHEWGISDTDIELWGLDQPGAPSPFSAGFVIGDLLDGDFDDFPDF